MEERQKSLACYVGAINSSLDEDWLRQRGFSGGMTLFAIPDYGILFRCRAEGELLDLEFGAFFALLRFIDKSLSKQRIGSVRVHSSNPELVFALLHDGPQIQNDSQRRKLLRKYRDRFKIEVSYIPPHRNQALKTPSELPAIPEGHELPVRPKAPNPGQGHFKPYQKGLQL